jgi:hypothetical protein
MSRLRDLGRDAADYFGLGERPDRVEESDSGDESLLEHALGLVAVLVLAFLLHGMLGFADDLVGFLVLLGLVAVLAMAWGHIAGVRGRRRAARRRGGSPR